MHKKYTLLLLTLCIASCNFNKDHESWDEANTRDVAVNDTNYLSAISKAQLKLPMFIDSLNNKSENHFDFFAKLKYSDGKNVEHMWFIVEKVHGDTIVAILDNVPLNLTNIKLSDKIEVNVHDIEDWIIYKGDSIIAGNFIVNK